MTDRQKRFEALAVLAQKYLHEKYGRHGFLPPGLAAQDEGMRILRLLASMCDE